MVGWQTWMCTVTHDPLTSSRLSDIMTVVSVCADILQAMLQVMALLLLAYGRHRWKASAERGMCKATWVHAILFMLKLLTSV